MQFESYIVKAVGCRFEFIGAADGCHFFEFCGARAEEQEEFGGGLARNQRFECEAPQLAQFVATAMKESHRSITCVLVLIIRGREKGKIRCTRKPFPYNWLIVMAAMG